MTEIFQVVRQNEIDRYISIIDKIDINIVDEDGQTLLHEAIAHDSNSIGFDLIKRNINVNAQDKTGRTALHFAAIYGNLELAKAIINSGGDPNLKDMHQNNALWTAVFNARGKYGIVELYKRSGGDVASKNRSNRSPLDFAKQINDQRLVDILGR